MDATERFERVADAFRHATGYPAIGKDAGPEYGGERWEEQRMALWIAFRAGYDFAVRVSAGFQREAMTTTREGR